MATRIDTDQQNAAVDACVDQFDGGTLIVYTGSQPASANDAATGTVLVTITLPTPAFGASATGTAAKNGTWSATVATSGIPGWYRLSSSGGTHRRDGSASGTGGGGDMQIADLVGGELIAGGTFTVDTFTVTQPAS